MTNVTKGTIPLTRVDAPSLPADSTETAPDTSVTSQPKTQNRVIQNPKHALERSEGSKIQNREVQNPTGRALYAAFLLVLAVSPFEAGYPPLTRFLNHTFTNLELTLLALTGALAVKLAFDAEARERLLRMPLLLPILALVAASALSTLFGEYRAQGVNYTYRLVMGGVVFASAWESLRSVRRLLVAFVTLILAGTVSAVLGLLEFATWTNIEPLLAAFKPMPTTVGGVLRLSGTFEYANGAALYFEMALPVLLSLAVLFASDRLVGFWILDFGFWILDSRSRVFGFWKRRGVVLVLLFALCAVLMMALLLTLSRAAWAGLVVAFALFALVPVRRRLMGGIALIRPVLGTLAVAVALMALGAAYLSVTQPVFGLRLTTENDRIWYTSSIQSGPLPTLSAGDWVTVPVTVRNDGPMVWRMEGALPVHVSYHWLSSDRGRYLVFEGARTLLPRDVRSGESVTALAALQAPSRAGAYLLQWDLVQENVAWFSTKGGALNEPVRAAVAEYSVAAQHKRPATGNMPSPINVQLIQGADAATVSRTRLWRVAFDMFRAHPLTGVGPDGFRNLYGKYAHVKSWNRNIYTNNTYVEMFTNLGLPGGLAFLTLVGLALWRAARNLLREPVSAAWVLGLGATAATVAHAFHGLADYFLFATPLYIIFWTLLAVSALWPLMLSQGAPPRPPTLAERVIAPC